eukprot:g18501.t1
MSLLFRFGFCLLASEFRDGVLAFKGIATPAGKPNQTRNSTSKRNVTNSTHVGRPLNLTTRNGTAKLNATLALARAKNTTKVAALNATNKTQKAKSTNGLKTPEVAVAAPGAGSETAMKDTKIKPEQPGGTMTSGAVVENKAAPAVGSSITTSAAAAPPQGAYSTKLKKERAASTSPPPALGKTANTAAKAAAPFTGVSFTGGEKGEKTYPASAMRSDAWFYSTSTVAPGSRSPAEKASGKASGGNASAGGLRPAPAEPAAEGGARSPVANSKAGPSDASAKTEEKKGETNGGPEQVRSSESAGSPFTTGFNFLLFLGCAAGCYWCVRSRPRAIFGNAME